MAPLHSIRTAQAIGITSAAFVAGGSLSISYLSIPAFLLSENPYSVSQWKTSYDRGKWTQQIIGAVSLGSFAYLAYKMEGTLNQHKAELYGICAFLNFLMWPWTMLVIMPTNTKLLDQHKETQEGGLAGKQNSTSKNQDSSLALVQRWGKMNFIRGLFPLAASFLGVWATAG